MLGYSIRVMYEQPHIHTHGPDTEVSAHGGSADELVFTTWVIIQLKAGDYAAHSRTPHIVLCLPTTTIPQPNIFSSQSFAVFYLVGII